MERKNAQTNTRRAAARLAAAALAGNVPSAGEGVDAGVKRKMDEENAAIECCASSLWPRIHEPQIRNAELLLREFAAFSEYGFWRVGLRRAPEKGMVHPDALRAAADAHVNLLAHHRRVQGILAAHAYTMHSRAADAFPPLFCFGDLVELELDCTSV
jgi:hypothetical protein